MKDSGSEKQPKPQPKWNGAPPKPPKRTTRDLLDGGDSSDEVFAVASRTSETWFELEKLRLGGAAGPKIRESLEAKLDAEIVALGGIVKQVEGVVRERVIDCLNSARDYRLHCPRRDASDSELARRARRVLDEAPQV